MKEIAKHLRAALFQFIFTGGMYKIEGLTKEYETGKAIANNFVIFGLNANLICMDEANDWIAAINEKMMLPEVLKKWDENYPVAAQPCE